jgi:hypothetical protein
MNEMNSECCGDRQTIYFFFHLEYVRRVTSYGYPLLLGVIIGVTPETCIFRNYS